MSNVILSVIIPYFDETPREIFPLLSSLDGQLGVDFGQIECILVNDGNLNVLPPEFLKLFENLPLRVIYAQDNKGPGVARQIGIDGANGEYVLFCDADDTLLNVFVLQNYIEVIQKENSDTVRSKWYEECINIHDNKARYMLHGEDTPLLPGKAIKLSFLREKNIRFHEELRRHEEIYFLNLVFAESRTTYALDSASYIWRHRAGSMTRKDNFSFAIETTPEHIASVSYSLEELEKRQPGQMCVFTTDYLMCYYFLFHQKHWMLAQNKMMLASAERDLKDKIKRFTPYYEKAPFELVAALYERKRALMFTHEKETEIETFDEWLRRIELKAL